MDILKNAVLAVTGFSGGFVVAAGVFAFIAVIGIVPRMAYRTKTRDYITVYEWAIIFGGIWGSTDLFMVYRLGIGAVGAIIAGLSMGVFMGILAMSLAEVLNVVPVFMKRGRMVSCLSLIIFVVALGKSTSGLIYFVLPNFY